MAVTRRTLRLADQLRIVLDDRVDLAVRDLVEAWARAWEQIDTEWQLAIEQLVAASKSGRWPSPTQIAQTSRAQRALAAATREILDLTEFTGVTVITAAREVAAEVAFWQSQLLASQMPSEAGTTAELVARFDRINPLSLGAIVERTTTQIESLKQPLSRAATEAMRQALVRGVALGENPRTAARRMVRLAEQRFNGGLTRAMTIARTEILDAHRTGTAAYHFDHADVLQGWAWHAKLDTRTCPSCWAKHGTVYQLQVTGPNDHQQGRCLRLPVVKPWSALGFEDVEEPPSLLTDARTRFAELPRRDQLKIMGPVRLQALEKGALDWSELTTRRRTRGWRDSWAPIPVGDARRRLLTPVS